MNVCCDETWDFTSDEIDQLVNFFRRWNEFDQLTDRSKVPSLKVQGHLIASGFMTPEWDVEDLKIIGRYAYTHMPPEGLWRIVREMFDNKKVVGKSITCHTNWWQYLGLFPVNDKRHTDEDLKCMVSVLSTLHYHNYIFFQTCGEEWKVTREK